MMPTSLHPYVLPDVERQEKYAQMRTLASNKCNLFFFFCFFFYTIIFFSDSVALTLKKIPNIIKAGYAKDNSNQFCPGILIHSQKFPSGNPTKCGKKK